MILAESQWFTPNNMEIGTAMKQVHKNYKNYLDGAKRQAYRSKTEFSWDKMKEALDNLLSTYVPEFPKQVELQLPSLNLPNL